MVLQMNYMKSWKKKIPECKSTGDWIEGIRDKVASLENKREAIGLLYTYRGEFYGHHEIDYAPTEILTPEEYLRRKKLEEGK